jgi:hypothetical protein
MKIHRLVAAGTAVLIVAGCDGGGALGPAAPTTGVSAGSVALVAGDASPVVTSGSFDALVDFSTLTLTPRGSNCLLQVNGRLVFHGAIEGVAVGQTTALVFGTCEDVASTPPGTDPDVFTSRLVFDGTVAGEPAHSKVLYQGQAQPGGHISGHLIFADGVSGVLDAEAQVAVGGTYSGSLVVH